MTKPEEHVPDRRGQQEESGVEKGKCWKMTLVSINQE